MLNISFKEQGTNHNTTIIIPISEQLKIDSHTMGLDQEYQGIISKTIQTPKIFNGSFGKTKTLTAINKDKEIIHIILLGIGDELKIKEFNIEELGGIIYTKAASIKADSVSIKIDTKIGVFGPEEVAAFLASGAMLASYKFDKYQTKKIEEQKFELHNFNLIVNDTTKTSKFFDTKKAMIQGVFLARDCITEPPNRLYPESYAERIVDSLDPLGVDVEVLGEREMRELNMGALLGVGQGSSNESKLVVMKYMGASEDQDPICLVGKGVTFDTGGISIKPALGMWDMKYDMAGSAAVVGAIATLAARRAKVNIVGVIGLVENMPDGNAQKPADVVTTMSGQTVEVLDTDAEGRLVLCDCVTYVQEKFKPACIIDLATLTGAITIALGNSYAGCFSNDDELANKIIKASIDSDEKLWRMPLHTDYDELLKSSIADMANISSERGVAGSSVAAQFIKRFIQKDIKWVHLDIASMAWNRRGKNSIYPKGATGFGIRLLNQFIKDQYETK